MPQNGAQRVTRLVLTDLRLPISLNNAYTQGAHGRRVLVSEGREYKATISTVVRLIAAAEGFVVPPRTPIRLAFVFFFARNNRDGSNTPKLLEDAISDALGFNDVWVWESSWIKRIDKRNPRCDVTIEVL
jgi:hypothetical protein